MEYNFFYGNQMVEFERPEVPEIIAKKGIQLSLAGRRHRRSRNVQMWIWSKYAWWQNNYST